MARTRDQSSIAGSSSLLRSPRPRGAVQSNPSVASIEFGAYALRERTEANRRFGSADLNAWILSLIDVKPGESVLDVACGYGQTALLYREAIGPSGRVVGTDLSPQLIQEAERQAGGAEGVTFLVHDADDPFPFEAESFDAVTCNFAIYHFPDMDRSILEFHSMLKPSGRLLITGPDRSNNGFLYQIHELAGGKIKADMARETFRPRIEKSLQARFARCHYHLFRNVVTFPSTDHFVDYYSKTQLFLSNTDLPEREAILLKVRNILEKYSLIQNEKVVGGFLAWKS